MNNFRDIRFKTRVRVILAGSIVTILFVFYICLGLEKLKCNNNPFQETQSAELETRKNAQKRESISFILGEDKEADNPYYSEALNYYLHNNSARTEVVITTCRTLIEVRDYLAENQPQNKLPWGLINLVSHGNQWMGLSAKVTPNSKRANAQSINEAVENAEFTELPNGILDNHSEIFLHGCGVGNNPKIVQALAKAFGGKDTIPLVRASKLFEYYASVKNMGAIIESERYLANAWYTVYKRGYRPENVVLSNRLRVKYSDQKLNWQDALTREQPRWPGDSYHYTFEVPVKWVVPFLHKDSIPDVSNNKKQLEWIASQTEIMEALAKINIPADKFNWWFRKVYVKNDDGERLPALWIKGYSTILCVLQALVTEENRSSNAMKMPFVPDINDPQYYYSFREQHCNN